MVIVTGAGSRGVTLAPGTWEVRLDAAHPRAAGRERAADRITVDGPTLLALVAAEPASGSAAG